LPKGQARARCKNCGENMVIEASGTVWAGSSAPSPSGFANSGKGSLAEHGVLTDYPALQSLPPNRVAFDEVFAANKKEGFKSRKNKVRVNIFTAVADVLDKLLQEGEQVMRVGRGTAYYPAEIFLGNGWLTMMYNHYAIVATNRRVLCINVNSRMKQRTHYLFQMLYGDIKKIKRSWLGSLAFQRIRSKQRIFTGVKGFLSRDLRDFISMILPGLGDLYLGHRTLGVLELIGSFAVWAYALAAVATGQPEGLIVAAFLLLLYNGMDGLLTYHMAKKGYMLA
jgi:hypothetical protein